MNTRINVIRKSVDVTVVEVVESNGVNRFELREKQTTPMVQPKRKLKGWVKKSIAGIVLAAVVAVGGCHLIDKNVVADSEVTWVEAYAQEGDGLYKLIRKANGSASLDMQDLVFKAEAKNGGAKVQAGEKVLIPVLKEAN